RLHATPECGWRLLCAARGCGRSSWRLLCASTRSAAGQWRRLLCATTESGWRRRFLCASGANARSDAAPGAELCHDAWHGGSAHHLRACPFGVLTGDQLSAHNGASAVNA
ncbi:unnamed protein product, partial [Durusdinium trenchii]